MESNLSRAEEHALKESGNLSKDSIERKKADETNIFVVMDKEEYWLVLEQHLNTNTYEMADKDINRKIYNKLEKLVNKYAPQLTQSEKRVILNKERKNSYFYVLPKVAKCVEITKQIERPNCEYVHMPMPAS